MDQTNRNKLYVWDVALQVTSPSRPALRHQLQYAAQAPKDGVRVAIEKAREYASQDGHTVVDVVSAVRRLPVNNPSPRGV
jgi:hypothetical protein